MQNNNERARMLREIQICNFTAVETHLFLDTHPDDQEALRFYEKTVNRLKELKEEYREKYGKIAARDNGQMRWAWVDEPWPWQMGV